MARVVYIIRHGHDRAAEAADEAGLGLYGKEQRQTGRGGQQEQRRRSGARERSAETVSSGITRQNQAASRFVFPIVPRNSPEYRVPAS